MIQDLSFEELPDKLKIEMLLKDNQSLRRKIEAEELENNSLYDEVDNWKRKYAALIYKSEESLKQERKIKAFDEMFRAKPNKVRNPNLSFWFIHENGYREQFSEWYSNKKEIFYPQKQY